jgi:hypothetical protein
MKYLLIKGSLHVVGYSPDGDSMMFKATNPAVWDALDKEDNELFLEKLTKENGAVQLRLEGIDALETHFTPMPLPTPPDLKSKEKASDKEKKPATGHYKQPEEIGRVAAEAFMWLVGVKKAEWRKFGKTTWISKALVEQNGQQVWLEEKQTERIPAYIVTSNIEKNGRPLAWVFPGDTDDLDGSELTKEALSNRLEKSVNYQLLRYGLVYPYFFMTLAGRMRDKLIQAVRLAQADAATKRQALENSTAERTRKIPNLWVYDRSVAEGIKITDLKNITDEMEIHPYLFRKIVKAWYAQQMKCYWTALREKSPYEFDENDKSLKLDGLFEDGDPTVFIVSDQDFVKLSEIIQIKDNTLQFLRHPMDIVFLS